MSTDDLRAGIGIGEDGDPMFTLQGSHQHAIAFKASHFTRGKDGKPSEVAPPLSADADQGDQDTLIFDTTQMTSKANRSNPKPGDPCHPLAAGGHAPAIAFSCKDHGADASEVSPTLRSMEFDKSHANGGGQVAVAFTERTRDEGRTLESQEELAYALTNPGSGGRTHSRQIMTPALGVRRLLPVECERLQGFPESYTAIARKGKEAADGPRYRALGNSMAVPVIAWLGGRIQSKVGK